MNKKIMYNGYLGGHAWITHTDQGALNAIMEKFSISTMVDIGCGPGGQVQLAKEMGIDAYGIDGDPRLQGLTPGVEIKEVDFTQQAYSIDQVDLAWSTEFVEHVEEKFLPSYMATFSCARYAFITHAPEGEESHACHHVNCKNSDYWIDTFQEYGFEYSPQVTKEIRDASTMKRNFVRENGLFFYQGE